MKIYLDIRDVLTLVFCMFCLGVMAGLWLVHDIYGGCP